jgi:hypothetical protein
MIRAFVFAESAVLVRHWVEIDAETAAMEHGARMELRRLDIQPQRGSGSAAQAFVIDRPVWRVDLFDRLDAPPGNYNAAHYHPCFDGDEPSDREFSLDLTADPLAWVRRRLSDIPATYAASNVRLAAGEGDDAERIQASADLITEAVAAVLPIQCESGQQCWELTSDVLDLMKVKISEVTRPDLIDRAYLAPWLAA